MILTHIEIKKASGKILGRVWGKTNKATVKGPWVELELPMTYDKWLEVFEAGDQWREKVTGQPAKGYKGVRE